MSYEIEWSDTAQNQMAAIWLAARDRQFLQESVDILEASLARLPAEVGESRGKKLRIVFEGPLKFLFVVLKSKRKVRVVSITRVRRPL